MITINKFNIGDKVNLIKGLDDSTGIMQENLEELYSKENLIIVKIEYSKDEELWSYEVTEGYWFLESELIKVEEEIINNKLKMRIKYFEGATKLQKITKGNWIDVYSNKDIFVPVGERAMIPLGFALELPQGWEGHLAPRSSTFKTWGIIQTNHVGVVDDSFIGDNDQWHMPVYCLQGKNSQEEGGILGEGTWIKKGDKIGQFRIMEVMPEIEFEEVESFGNADRGGFGTTSSR